MTGTPARGWRTMLMLLAALGCAPAPPDSKVPGTTATGAGNATSPASTPYREAPSLAARVAAGELAAVADRLPRPPLLLESEETPGRYGGTLEVLAPNPTVPYSRLVSYEPLVRWDQQWQRVQPNVAQAVEVNNDATEFRFRLRSGLRWSDGEVFDAEDVLFWYHQVLLEPALTPRPMAFLSRGGEPVSVTAPDPNTVVFRFKEPNAFFLQHMAGVLGAGPTRYPAHYLSRYHGHDTTEPADRAADWTPLFRAKASPIGNPELPTLDAWQLRVSDGEMVAERNPFYWKIDSEYRQLPYLDRIVVHPAADPQRIASRHGESDRARLFFADDYRQAAATAHGDPGFAPITLVPDSSSVVAVGLNLNHRDTTLRELFLDKRFRIALSLALDRPRMIRELCQGRCEAYQVAPRPESPFYSERFAHQYTAHDPERAAALLDEMGLDHRNAHGVRLDALGRPIAFRLQAEGVDSLPLRLIAADWSALGLDVTLTEYSSANHQAWVRELFDNRHDTYVSAGVGGLDLLLQPVYYVPAYPYGSWYAEAWGRWYRNPADPRAQQPPPPVRRQLELHRELQRTVAHARQRQLVSRILELAERQFYAIGTVLKRPSTMFVSASLGNVCPVMPEPSVFFPAPGPANPAQFYLRAADAAGEGRR